MNNFKQSVNNILNKNIDLKYLLKLIFLSLISIIIGLIIGVQIGKSICQKKAIKKGFAYYTPDKGKFAWKEKEVSNEKE